MPFHRTESRRAFWLRFALFELVYVGMSPIPSIESRLITTKALDFVVSNVPPSTGAGLAHYDKDGSMDLYVVNNSQQNALYRDKGNGTFDNAHKTTTIFPLASFDSMTRCASWMSSKRNTRDGFAL